MNAPAEEPIITRGYCVRGCGAIITGPLVDILEVGSGAAPAYVGGHDCEGRPDRDPTAPRRHLGTAR